MPSPNTVQFSLTSDLKAKLESLAIEGESIGLTAKRILLEAIGNPIDRPVSKSQLEAIEERLTALEYRLSVGTIDNFASKTTQAENLPHGDRSISLQNKFCVVSLNREKQLEKFWSGRDWSEDLSKAKIFESERGASASVKSLKSKGYKNVAFNSCDRLYEMLSEQKKAIANLYWIKEND